MRHNWSGGMVGMVGARSARTRKKTMRGGAQALGCNGTTGKMPQGLHKKYNHTYTARVLIRPHGRNYFSMPLQGWLVLAVWLPATGCVSPWWNAFLSPQEVGNFRENRVNEIQQSISFRDKPLGISGAVDPTPDDLIATVEEYMIGPNDVLSVRLLDFIQLGYESELTLRVDELGYVHVPQLGWLHIEGMTVRQVQSCLVQQAKDVGIYPVDADPTVVVQLLSREQRTYNISGAISLPGPYSVVRPDFRLREAINRAGGLSDTVKTIYIFRNQPRQKQVREASAFLPSPRSGDEPEQPESPVLPEPPVTPISLSEFGMAAGPMSRTPASEPEPGRRQRAGQGLAVPPEEVEKDLLEAISPVAAPSAPAEAPTESPTSAPPAGTPAMPTFIYVNNRFVEAPGPSTATAATRSLPATTPIATAPPPAGPSPTGVVDWEELASEGQQRVIRIPADKIRHGDPNYDVVIKHQDWIRLDAGPVGTFYLMGHVVRPGVYSLTGQEITLTQAIAAAGGFDAIAWPTRCEIRRRIDGDREEITQWDLARIMDGRDRDLFLKKDDVVNVGTHAIAPLLATIRNSFRLTYGFGFVYDRNFADIDRYFAKPNPESRRRNERLQRGLLP